MNVKVFAQRIGLAYSALAGRLDDVPAMVKELTELRARMLRLNKAMCDLSDQRDYWYRLWNAMGRDFEHTQNVLCEKIDELRKQIAGQWDGTPFMDGKIQEHWHSLHVEPKHPVNPEKCPDGFVVEVPPKRPDPEKV
ncbi:MAG: hypothetical protein WC683_02230 [bacterium]